VELMNTRRKYVGNFYLLKFIFRFDFLFPAVLLIVYRDSYYI
jgi:hypothetical protein